MTYVYHKYVERAPPVAETCPSAMMQDDEEGNGETTIPDSATSNMGNQASKSNTPVFIVTYVRTAACRSSAMSHLSPSSLSHNSTKVADPVMALTIS